ncbi:MAG: hypothetical protein H0T62_08905, partial [Parachlamydiaceae bacterium]|nr:hypothetical protein [Parachlamydiaceae bacterium]
SKMHCKDEAVDLYAKSVLNNLEINYYFGDAPEILLRHVFQELTSNCDVVEVDSILEVYREEAEAVESTKNKMQIIAEKVISVFATILHILVTVAVLTFMFLIWYNLEEILEHVPLILTLILIPIMCFLPLICAEYVSPQISDATDKAKQFMEEGSTFLESVRRARELQQAETLWVNQIMALKVSAGAA